MNINFAVDKFAYAPGDTVHFTCTIYNEPTSNTNNNNNNNSNDISTPSSSQSPPMPAVTATTPPLKIKSVHLLLKGEEIVGPKKVIQDWMTRTEKMRLENNARYLMPPAPPSLALQHTERAATTIVSAEGGKTNVGRTGAARRRSSKERHMPNRGGGNVAGGGGASSSASKQNEHRKRLAVLQPQISRHVYLYKMASVFQREENSDTDADANNKNDNYNKNHNILLNTINSSVTLPTVLPPSYSTKGNALAARLRYTATLIVQAEKTNGSGNSSDNKVSSVAMPERDNVKAAPAPPPAQEQNQEEHGEEQQQRTEEQQQQQEKEKEKAGNAQPSNSTKNKTDNADLNIINPTTIAGRGGQEQQHVLVLPFLVYSAAPLRAASAALHPEDTSAAASTIIHPLSPPPPPPQSQEDGKKDKDKEDNNNSQDHHNHNHNDSSSQRRGQEEMVAMEPTQPTAIAPGREAREDGGEAITAEATAATPQPPPAPRPEDVHHRADATVTAAAAEKKETPKVKKEREELEAEAETEDEHSDVVVVRQPTSLDHRDHYKDSNRNLIFENEQNKNKNKSKNKNNIENDENDDGVRVVEQEAPTTVNKSILPLTVATFSLSSSIRCQIRKHKSLLNLVAASHTSNRNNGNNNNNNNNNEHTILHSGLEALHQRGYISVALELTPGMVVLQPPVPPSSSSSRTNVLDSFSKRDTPPPAQQNSNNNNNTNNSNNNNNSSTKNQNYYHDPNSVDDASEEVRGIVYVKNEGNLVFRTAGISLQFSEFVLLRMPGKEIDAVNRELRTVYVPFHNTPTTTTATTTSTNQQQQQQQPQQPQLQIPQKGGTKGQQKEIENELKHYLFPGESVSLPFSFTLSNEAEREKFHQLQRDNDYTFYYDKNGECVLRESQHERDEKQKNSKTKKKNEKDQRTPLPTFATESIATKTILQLVFSQVRINNNVTKSNAAAPNSSSNGRSKSASKKSKKNKDGTTAAVEKAKVRAEKDAQWHVRNNNKLYFGNVLHVVSVIDWSDRVPIGPFSFASEKPKA